MGNRDGSVNHRQDDWMGGTGDRGLEAQRRRRRVHLYRVYRVGQTLTWGLSVNTVPPFSKGGQEEFIGGKPGQIPLNPPLGKGEAVAHSMGPRLLPPSTSHAGGAA